jgi:sulfur-oxidizing protein SoxA
MIMRVIFQLLPAGLLLTVIVAQAAEPMSGYDYLIDELKQMQDDEFENPGLLAVDAGAELFAQTDGNGKSCASCHGEGGVDLDTGQLARYPLYDSEQGKPVTLRGQILACNNQRLSGDKLEYADRGALQLETFVRRLALGETIAVDVSGPMASHYEAGSKLFHSRWGQVDIACHQCHDYHAGRTFRGQLLSQGQSNGLPAYRYTTGNMVGTHERITECLTSLRAEPYPVGSAEYVDMEVYMNARGNGLKIETPGIRY